MKVKLLENTVHFKGKLHQFHRIRFLTKSHKFTMVVSCTKSQNSGHYSKNVSYIFLDEYKDVCKLLCHFAGN